MIFAHEIPELSGHPSGFPGYWVMLIFTGTLDQSYAAKALVSNYVRHVEAASTYRKGRAQALKFIHHDGSSVPIYDFLAASSEFEHCIGDTHRAIQCMRGIIRNQAVPQVIRNLFSHKPGFTKSATMNQVKNIRNAVQHTYDMIAKGEISEDSPYVLAIDGLEVPVADSDQPGQVLKTFDRLRIGSQHITLEELRIVLEEMGACAERIAGLANGRT